MVTRNGNAWLGCAFVLFSLSLAATLVAFSSGSTFDLGAYSTDYYAARIPYVIVVTVVSILLPLSAAAASGIAALVRPREAWRTMMALLILCAALASVWFCAWLGIGSVQQTIRFAENSPM
jgi:hypothetical protein